MNSGCSWSGGKDSCFALMQALAHGYKAVALVNMMNENGLISRSHGLPESILRSQSLAMNLPLISIPSSWAAYQQNFTNALLQIKKDFGAVAMVFGDIDLQQHRDWEEMVCADAGLQAILPLWQKDRRELVMEMIASGISARIVSCNLGMGPSFLGRAITEQLVTELEQLGIDPCGENGEYHTVVTNCPLFSKPVHLPAFSAIRHEHYWFIQWDNGDA